MTEREWWIEDDVTVTLRGYGYWTFHEMRDYTDSEWTTAQMDCLENAAQVLQQWLNANWPQEKR